MNMQEKLDPKVEEKLRKIFEQAREQGEAYITTLTPQELKQTGFEADEDFFNFKYVDIYLLYDDQFVLKYVFNGDYSNTFYETTEDLQSLKYMIEAITTYAKKSI